MESDPSTPHNHFDMVLSIYALGWTLDLDATLKHISSYLKRDGLFIFSWDHPLMHCVKEVDAVKICTFSDVFCHKSAKALKWLCEKRFYELYSLSGICIIVSS
ncbi:methyltransferase domain-containing protein [Fusibacter paucivorans]|uniref:Methyltransferase domain-containing protein n=1 Tax=Fusibacter paucivorans TaxID=76009 RepID=A0ABS5PUD9_9FIRM|nr:methyltransferase domain-containing protein [Fusibacter paucivorans]MBS7528774.1 methyltransferase domain-containing protein [Fusibacter paucivorans]